MNGNGPQSMRLDAPRPPSFRPQAMLPQAMLPQAMPPQVFARQPQPTPYGYSQPSQQQGLSQYGDLSVPVAPHSLAPVAMHSSTHSGSYNASVTGPHRAETVVIREKPSLKWGIMIAMSGALLGGVLGLGMDARNKQGRAAAAAEARENAPAQQALAPLAAPIAPPVTLAQPVAVAPAPIAPAHAAPVVLPTSAGVVVPPKDPVGAKTASHRFTPAARPVPAAHTFAVKVRPPVAPQEPAEKPEPAAKPEKKPVGAAAPSRDASTRAAQDLLEQANKDTSSTLSGR